MAQQSSVNPAESLRTLLRLQSPTNVPVNGDPYMAKRRADILSGVEDYVPGGDSADYRAAQDAGMTVDEQGVRHQASAGSRDSYRASDIAKLKQVIGLKQAEDAASLQRVTAPQQIAGEFGVKRQELANQGNLEAEKVRAAGLRDQYSARADQAAQVQAAKQAAVKPVSPTSAQTTALSKARDAYGSMGNKVRGFLHMQPQGRAEYESALNDVLVRSGSFDWISQMAKSAQASGMTGSDAIAEAGSQGVDLNPYEQEYLKLTLGE